jgi:hypothetical protein
MHFITTMYFRDAETSVLSVWISYILMLTEQSKRLFKQERSVTNKKLYHFLKKMISLFFYVLYFTAMLIRWFEFLSLIRLKINENSLRHLVSNYFVLMLASSSTREAEL